MSRWFRHYAGMMRDEKLVGVALRCKQPVERVIWVWGAILESAAEINDGGRYELDTAEVAYFLRSDESDVVSIEAGLAGAGRVRENCVVKWGDRQFQSDRSASRQKDYRDRKRTASDGRRDGIADIGDVKVTSPSRHGDAPETETETETEKKAEAIASAAVAASQAPVYTDSRHELWGEGTAILVQLGLAEKSARANIGRWLKGNDDTHKLLGVIQRARDNRIINPIPWITQALAAPTGTANVAEDRSLIAAARGARDSVARALELGDRASEPVFRLIPQG